MRRIIALSLLALPVLAAAQPTLAPSLVGTTTVVNDGPGDQSDPHVSGDVVAYTSAVSGLSEIRYHDLKAGTDSAVPSNGGLDDSPDTSGTIVTYTHHGNGAVSIYTYDLATGGAPVEVAPQAGSNRRFSSIGGSTIAWQDFGFASTTLAPEIVVYDQTMQTSVRLTNDTVRDNPPTVSPDGHTVVWTKCTGGFSGCDAWSATLSNGTWTARALTGAEGEETGVDTDGVLAVYGSSRGGEDDIYWQPVAGGAEQHLVFPGADRNPRIAGHLIGFEHFDDSAATPNWDLYVYDMSTNNLYRLTSTPVDEEFNDISVAANGVVRVVWDAAGGSGTDVFAFSFLAPGACNPPRDDGDDAEDICEHPGNRPMVAQLEMVRGTGQPQSVAISFPAVAGKGALCVENHRATSGTVSLGGYQLLGPSDFQHGSEHLARRVDLQESNPLAASIAGKPGTSYVIRIYGRKPPICPGDSGDDGHDRDAMLYVTSPSQVRTIAGVPATVIASSVRAEDFSGTAAGCSAAGGGLVPPAVLALLAASLLRRTSRGPARRS